MPLSKNQIMWRAAIPPRPDRVLTYYEAPYESDLINESAEVVNATATLYTVPADHVFYLTDIVMGCGWTATGYIYMIVKDSVPTNKYFLGRFDGTNGNAQVLSHNFSIALKLVAGDYITVHSSAAGVRAYVTITGYEKDA